MSGGGDPGVQPALSREALKVARAWLEPGTTHAGFDEQLVAEALLDADLRITELREELEGAVSEIQRQMELAERYYDKAAAVESAPFSGIKPALSPEQWHPVANRISVDVVNYRGHREGFVDAFGPGGDLAFWHADADLPALIIGDPQQRHALAALALYQQPFGFQQQDVKYLREIVQAIDTAVTAFDLLIALEALDAERGRSLAARIAALLPPEEK